MLPESASNGEPLARGFFIRAIRRRWRWVAAGAALGLLVAVLLAAFMPRTYTSTASVFLDPLVGNPYSPTTPSSRTEQLAALTTEAGIVLTDTVIADATASAAEQGVDIEPVRPNTSTEVPSNTQVIDISFSAREPETGRVGAQELARSFLAFRADRAETVRTAQSELLEQRRAAIEELLNSATAQLDALGDSQGAAAIDLQQQVGLYAQQLAQVKLEQTSLASTEMSPGTILNPAGLPDGPDGVNPAVLAFAALLLFTSFGVLAALFAEHIDRRIGDEEDVVRWGAPVPLGDVSTADDSEGGQFLHALPNMEPALEGGAAVLIGAGGPRSVIDTAIGFASASALSGKTACVIIASSGSSARPGAGLSDVLAGSHDVGDLADLYIDEGGGVRVLAAGTRSQNLPALVQAELCSTLTERIMSDFDLVLVATTWDERATAVRFARIVGAVVLVAEKQKTLGTSLLSMATALRQLAADVKGTVLVRAAAPEAILHDVDEQNPDEQSQDPGEHHQDAQVPNRQLATTKSRKPKRPLKHSQRQTPDRESEV